MQLKTALNLQKVFTKLDEYAANFGGNFVLGLSGGGDSMALLAICRVWQLDREKAGQKITIHACIIDHGIANNSAQIAEISKERAEKLGIQAEIIKLNEKIEVKLQENARKLRHLALGEFAKSKSAKLILLAHNKNDQIETVLFRMLRGTRLDGLAGMRELSLSPFVQDIILARPLMDFSRDELRGLLEINNLQYFDDPANSNDKFARVKIRTKISVLEKNDFNFAKLLSIGQAAQELRYGLDELCANFLERNLEFSENTIRLRRANDDNVPKIIVSRVLSIVLEAHCQRDYRIEAKKIDNLFQKINTETFKSATLAGVKISKTGNTLKFEYANPRKGHEKISISTKEIRYRINHILWHNGADINI